MKTIVITGASGGIGRELVRELGKTYRVIAQHRRPNVSLQQIADENDDILTHQCDIDDETGIQSLVKFVDEWCSEPWGVINLAGSTTNAMSWKLTTEEFKEVLSDNLYTTFLTCRAFIPVMRKASQGRIINTSSVVAFTGTVGAAHYCAAKAAIVGYDKSLALELANRNITVNTLALGYFDAGMINQVPGGIQGQIIEKTPLKRLGEVKEATGLVKYLLSEEAGFVTGQVHHINGGLF